MKNPLTLFSFGDFGRRSLSEGFWVSGGQLLAALGLLVGVRIQTEYVPPHIFGNVVLLLGFAALAVGTFCTPALQAAIRFYPDAERSGCLSDLRVLVGSRVTRNAAYLVAATLACGTVYSYVFDKSFWEIAFLAGIVLVDSVRSLAMVFLNAAFRQRPYAVWSILEAWGRPAAAVACALVFDATSHAVMGGYFLASVINIMLFVPILRKDWTQSTSSRVGCKGQLADALKSYSKPLIPLAILGWISSLSDRYIIAGVLGLTEAGVYSATYGLISRPFLVAYNALELTVRPHYFNCVSKGDQTSERQMFRQWLIFTAAGGLCLLLAITMGRGPITRNLLGSDYWGGRSLMPLIAMGYTFLIVSYSLNAYLYAHKNTSLILMLGVTGAALSVVLVLSTAHIWGLLGVASACAITYGLLMLMTGAVVSIRMRSPAPEKALTSQLL